MENFKIWYLKYIFQRSSSILSTKQIILVFLMNRRYLKMNLVYFVNHARRWQLNLHVSNVTVSKPPEPSHFATIPNVMFLYQILTWNFFSEPKPIVLLQCFKSISTYKKFVLFYWVLIELLHQLKLFTRPPLFCNPANHDLSYNNSTFFLLLHPSKDHTPHVSIT